MINVDALKASISLEQLVGNYLELKKEGTQHWVACCPFHQERTPSFTVTPEKGFWKCFGCDESGDAISFIERMESLTFQEAVKRLQEITGYYEPAPAPPTQQSKPEREERGKITATYKYLDEEGKALYEICRIEPGRNGKAKDFLQRYVDSDTGQVVWKKHPRQVLYRLPEVLASDSVIVVEGEKDVDNLFKLGLVATTNAGGCKAAWLPGYTQSLRGKSVVVIPDNDEPGMKHAEDVLVALKGIAAELLLIRLPVTGKGEDVSDWINLGADRDDILRLIESERLEVRREQFKRRGLIRLSEIEQTMENPMAVLDPTVRPPGIKTGFSRFDEMTNGLHDGSLTVFGGRPSMGKTALALNVASHVASSGKRVGIFSLEMSREELLARLLCTRARVDSHQYRLGYLKKNERTQLARAYEEMKGWDLFIDEHASLDVQYMAERLREQPVDLVIVDYLQLMRMQGKQRENRTQEVGAHSRGLKLLAREIRKPVITLSQLSRALELRENKRPTMSDLRESGDIEQDADIVAFVYREEVYKRDRPELKGLAELIVAKQRNGPTGTVQLVWLSSIVKFENKLEAL